MAGFGAEVLDDIRARVDIVELVGQVVNLKRAGENWKGLCPFHTERTPSFTVNPKRGIFHCFGCGAGGDAFRFLMRHDRLAFPEAVRALAERTGVTLAASREVEPEGRGQARGAAAGDGAGRRVLQPITLGGGRRQGARVPRHARRRYRGRPALRARLCPRVVGRVAQPDEDGRRRRRSARPGRSRAAAPDGRRLLRSLPRAAALPDPGYAGAGRGLRRPRSRRGRAQVPQLPGDAALRQGTDPVRARRRPARPCASAAGPSSSRATSTA